MAKEHTIRQYDAELNDIRRRILEMGEKVDHMISGSVKALVDRDSELADRTMLSDLEINQMEMETDERCLEVIARWQPAANDLRFLTLALKVVTELERIGDQCVSLARNVKKLNEEPPLKPYVDLPRLAGVVRTMVSEALEAFLHKDVKFARKVCKDVTCVDDLSVRIHKDLLTQMMEDPSTVTRAMKLTHISRCLEIIADHAKNLAEMVIFIIIGKDIRHTMG